MTIVYSILQKPESCKMGSSGLCGGVEALRPPQSRHRSRITASRARPATRLWLPWGWRLSSHWSARGQRPGRPCPATGCQLSWTTPSSHRIPAFCTCGGYGDNFFFNLSCVPAYHSIGHLAYNWSLKAVTAK